MSEINDGENGGVRISTQNSAIPNLDGMTPKEMRRAWLKFMASHDWPIGSLVHTHAEFVRLAIDMLRLNTDLPSETWARNSLKEQIAMFSNFWAQWRG